MRITIKDVAKDAGVSVATVSNVVNNTKPVADKTRKKVLKSIEKLDFRMNRMAHNLKVGKSHTIAFVVADMTNPFFLNIAVGIEHVLRSHGYSLILVNSDERLRVEKEQIDNLMNQSIDGIVIAPTTNNHEYLKDYMGPDFPLVFIDRKPKGVSRDCVLTDNYSASYDAASYLIGLGHRSVGLISGLVGLTTSFEREEGFIQAFKDNGIDFPQKNILNGDGRKRSGYFLMQQLENNSDISAVFVTNNLMALGALNYLNENQIAIPEDISFVMFDEYEWASIYRPALTVIRQNISALGEKAAEVLLEQIEHGMNADRERVFRMPAELVIRSSCRNITS
jgi:LacI family transcriptional regulator